MPIVRKNGEIATTATAPTHRALLIARSSGAMCITDTPVGSIGSVSRWASPFGPPRAGDGILDRTNGGVLPVSLINVTREAPIATVQLDRPEVRNALSGLLMDELVAALETLDDDPEIRCIVLTGDEKAFSGGADIKKSFVEATPASMLEGDLTSKWERVRKIR